MPTYNRIRSLLLAGTAPSLVSVPTHFYKVVAATGCKTAASNGDNRTGVAAFVMPNAPIDPKTPLSAFVVPLEALEAASGELNGRSELRHYNQQVWPCILLPFLLACPNFSQRITVQGILSSMFPASVRVVQLLLSTGIAALSYCSNAKYLQCFQFKYY